jgi:hypothetical protein
MEELKRGNGKKINKTIGMKRGKIFEGRWEESKERQEERDKGVN